jgi:hypothetical protein
MIERDFDSLGAAACVRSIVIAQHFGQVLEGCLFDNRPNEAPLPDLTYAILEKANRVGAISRSSAGRGCGFAIELSAPVIPNPPSCRGFDFPGSLVLVGRLIHGTQPARLFHFVALLEALDSRRLRNSSTAWRISSAAAAFSASPAIISRRWSSGGSAMVVMIIPSRLCALRLVATTVTVPRYCDIVKVNGFLSGEPVFQAALGTRQLLFRDAPYEGKVGCVAE